MPEELRSPYTDDQVASINSFQDVGRFHPFTCGTAACGTRLLAVNAGLLCPKCNYTQQWVWAWMADWSWRPSAMDRERIPDVRSGRVFEVITPSPGDITRANELPLTACPRRYCWWWQSLSFDWEIPANEGCTYLNVPKPSHWLDTDKPCCRCDTSSQVDHYEPREPHLEHDGFHRHRYCGPQKDLPERK